MTPAEWEVYRRAQLSHAANPGASGGDYPPSLEKYLPLADCRRAMEEIRQWPGYAPTPLHSLKELAEQAGAANIFYKDESRRFGLGSFKALGGAYAVFQLAAREIGKTTGAKVDRRALAAGDCAQHAKNITAAAATDGNHGRAVAWGAKRIGCQCRIYIHAGVSDERKRAMESLGAQVTRVEGNYDDSVRLAAEDAQTHGWFVVADTADSADSPDSEMTRQVMAGYCLMLEETLEQLPSSPSHFFVQGGVGGLAAAAAAWLWRRLGAGRPRIIVAEPVLADCLLQSARRQQATTVRIVKETLMAGLSCGKPSQTAWPILQAAAGDFVAMEDALVPPLMRCLRRDNGIECGESAATGLAAFLACAAGELRKPLGIDGDSHILVLGTEGATDPRVYTDIIAGGDGAAQPPAD